MRKLILVPVILAFCASLSAQQTMDNDAVIKLVKAGLSDDLIITTINSSPGNYEYNTHGLMTLKAAGVSDRIVAAIIAKVTTPANSAASTMTAAGANPDDPAAPHEAGIYIFSADAPVGSKMAMLEPSVYSQQNMGGGLAFALTYGLAKMKMKAVIRGAHSNLRLNDTQPTFYFYFEQTRAGLSNSSLAFGGTSTPNEYTLLKFEIKGDSRETVTGKVGTLGTSTGTDDKASVPFTYTKLRPGVYKVVLSASLQPGEYGFISSVGGGNSSFSRVFDFGRN